MILEVLTSKWMNSLCSHSLYSTCTEICMLYEWPPIFHKLQWKSKNTNARNLCTHLRQRWGHSSPPPRTLAMLPGVQQHPVGQRFPMPDIRVALTVLSKDILCFWRNWDLNSSPENHSSATYARQSQHVVLQVLTFSSHHSWPFTPYWLGLMGDRIQEHWKDLMLATIQSMYWTKLRWRGYPSLDHPDCEFSMLHFDHKNDRV